MALSQFVYLCTSALPAGEGSLRRYSEAFCAALQPHLAEGRHVVKTVHCAEYYSVALFDNGQLLLLAPDLPQWHGTFINCSGEVVVDVASGDTHFAFCTVSGAVYTMGYSNRYGQLGDGSVWDSYTSKRSIGEGGSCHSQDLATAAPPLSEPRRISGFGPPLSSVGTQVGDDSPNSANSAAPMANHTDASVSGSLRGPSSATGARSRLVCICAVACGAHHTLLMTAARNSVYAAGRGHCGQLGGKRPVPLQPVFRAVRWLFGLPVKQIAAASHHSFMLLSTGKLLACGENSCGQLGMGHTSSVIEPTPVVFMGTVLNSSATHAAASENGMPRRLLDAKAFSSLRAAYGSAESTYYPLRVKRVDAERRPSDPFVAAVWCCDTTTVLLSRDLEWFSCGLALSCSRAGPRTEGVVANYDRQSGLGRLLLTKSDARAFGRMCWSKVIEDAIRAEGCTIVQSLCDAKDDSSILGNRATNQLECFCYANAVIVKVPHCSSVVDTTGKSSSAATLFCQGSVNCTGGLVLSVPQESATWQPALEQVAGGHRGSWPDESVASTFNLRDAATLLSCRNCILAL